MSSVKRLQSDYESFDELYTTLVRKLRRLRSERIYETDVAIKIKLDEQIRQGEEEKEAIEQRLDIIEQQLRQVNQPLVDRREQHVDFDSLHAALLKLGYREQQRLFKRITKTHSVGAFLIHGCSPQYGQRWLLNRLVREAIKNVGGKSIKIDLGRHISKTDIPALWRELARRVGLQGDSLSTDIVNGIHQLWQTQDVTIVFDKVNDTSEENLRELIEEFWDLLSNTVFTSSQKSEFKLLMFLLDYRGWVCSWNLTLAKQYGSNWKPFTPIALPEIALFSEEELTNWIEIRADSLPSHLSDEVETVVKSILEKTDSGIPELTLQEICDLCGCNWYEQEDKWLKL